MKTSATTHFPTFLAKQVERHQQLAQTQADEKVKQGLVCYHQGEYTLAVELFTEAIILVPKNCRYRRHRALANWTQIGTLP